MKTSIFFDLVIIGVLMYIIAFILSNTEKTSIVSNETSYWSGDDTLKIMFVKDSAYIVKK
jgi:hypothetical protein